MPIDEVVKYLKIFVATAGVATIALVLYTEMIDPQKNIFQNQTEKTTKRLRNHASYIDSQGKEVYIMLFEPGYIRLMTKDSEGNMTYYHPKPEDMADVNERLKKFREENIK